PMRSCRRRASSSCSRRRTVPTVWRRCSGTIRGTGWSWSSRRPMTRARTTTRPRSEASPDVRRDVAHPAGSQGRASGGGLLGEPLLDELAFAVEDAVVLLLGQRLDCAADQRNLELHGADVLDFAALGGGEQLTSTRH